MVDFPNAKINLGLHITERRPDGFHNLESVFCAIDYCDVLEIQPEKSLQFSSSGLEIPPSTSGNLCLQAYRLLQEEFDLPPVHIHLHKVIPIGAGLGGGSADAAFTLKMLKQLFDLKLRPEQLEEYARQLGSDCPFFIRNESRFCEGTGDIFTPCHLPLQDYKAHVVYPGIHVSTAEAYRGINPKKADTNLRQSLQQEAVDNWKTFLVNDFEQVIFPRYPELIKIKEQLYEAGALYVAMSGSGSCIYGIFEASSSYQGENLPSNYTYWQANFLSNHQ